MAPSPLSPTRPTSGGANTPTIPHTATASPARAGPLLQTRHRASDVMELRPTTSPTTDWPSSISPTSVRAGGQELGFSKKQIAPAAQGRIGNTYPGSSIIRPDGHFPRHGPELGDRILMVNGSGSAATPLTSLQPTERLAEVRGRQPAPSPTSPGARPSIMPRHTRFTAKTEDELGDSAVGGQ